MQALTKVAEAKLLSAIEQAAAYVNDGMTPNAAIVKAASAADVPQGHLALMVHAYNTGRTTKQRELSDDPLEKAADFPLADLAEITAQLYPTTVKTSGEVARASGVSPEYVLPVAGMLARRKAAQAKAAAAKVSLPEKTWVPPPRDEAEVVRRAMSQKRAAELAYEELRRQATVAYHKAAAAMDTLCDYFRRPGNMSFQDAVRETELRLGDTGVSVLKKVAAVYPHFEKQASTGEDFFGDLPVVTLVDGVIKAVDYYNAAKARVPEKQAQSKKVPAQVLTGSILPAGNTEPLQLKAAAGVDGPIPKMPGLLGAAQGVAGSMGKNTALEAQKLKQKSYNSLTDPEHETALRNVRAQGVLHDLILNDPVISGHDPKEVALAFNDLADASPSFVDSPSAMTALLRKRLEAGQLADFDVAQLVNMEKARADTAKAQMDTRKLERELI